MFDLALRLNKTVGEIGKMPSRELAEWMAYFNVQAAEMREKDMEAQAASLATDARNTLSNRRNRK